MVTNIIVFYILNVLDLNMKHFFSVRGCGDKFCGHLEFYIIE